MNNNTNPNYWDCNCETEYIHHKTKKSCNLCKANSEDAPDSMTNEVEQYCLDNPELTALQNAGARVGLNVARYYPNNRRIKSKMFVFLCNGTSVSPAGRFSELNHFILGFIKAKETI